MTGEEVAVRADQFTWTRIGGWTGLPSDGGAVSLVLVFGASGVADERIAELVGAFPGVPITGCSSAGEIVGERVEDDSIVGVAIRFVDTQVRLVSGPVNGGCFEPGLASSLIGPGLAAVLVFSDGLNGNGDAMVRTFRDLGISVPVFGGLAGDGSRFQRTWILDAGQKREGRVALVGLYGDRVRVTTGSEGGWEPFGPERSVTSADGAVLREIDGEPALALYKRYLGDRIGALPASALLFPIALFADEGGYVVRTVLAVDEASGTMTFAGELPAGSRVRLMRASQDRLVDGAAAAAEAAAQADAGVVLAVSCVGRRLVLGERVEEEVEATFAQMPQGSQQIGFYSYGEISPDGDGVAQLHNQTMTLAVLTEVSAHA